MKPSRESHRRGRRLLTVLGVTVATLAVAPVTKAVADNDHYTVEEDTADPASTTTVAAASASTASTASSTAPLGSMYAVVDQIGARPVWRDGATGAGVNVALIDTGVAPVADLGDAVIAEVDLSGEAGIAGAAYVDTYGHGTFMAGIIAGQTPGSTTADAAAHPEWFLGVAPDAGLVSIKVGDNSGAADVTQVIAGIDWAVDHASDLGIRVINLSYSSGSVLPYRTDPLTFALERAWQAGIVVVVAAGNDGAGSRGLSSPANDPYVIAAAPVEAMSNGTFSVPSWVSRGDGSRNPDVAAPGAHIISLRAPGSRIDTEHPEGYVSPTLFKGSGSSEAAAVVSGSAALLLSAHPELTPDQVKDLLARNTLAPTDADVRLSGAGIVQVDDVIGLTPTTASQTWPRALGTASVEAARGNSHIQNSSGNVVSGDEDVRGAPFDGTRWTGTRWTAGEWNGTRWTGGEWMGTRWTAGAWSGTRWTGTRWTGTRWTGTRWTGTRWTGTRWTGTRWTGTRWTGTRWTSIDWAGAVWSSGTWS